MSKLDKEEDQGAKVDEFVSFYWEKISFPEASLVFQQQLVLHGIPCSKGAYRQRDMMYDLSWYLLQLQRVSQ